tara:strand:+ start:969 stop:1364 length:396 start_codon:yes stop_codon:yes gene_type:complete
MMAKKNQTKSDTLKKAMIAAMEKSLGVVSSAAKAAGISRDTHYRWMKEDEEYANQANDLSEVALDFAESSLHRQIQGGQTAATIFFLKCKGRGRGYIEKQEIDFNNHSGPDLSALSTEELIAILKDEDEKK